MIRVENQLGFVLHRRAFKESSIIIDVFTQEHGLVSLLARGAKRAKGNSGFLQPFRLLNLSYVGRTDLKILTNVEFNTSKGLFNIAVENIVIGMYVNELLIKLLAKHDAHMDLFDAYLELIMSLNNNLQHKNLRIFEHNLLKNIGYDLPLTYEANTSLPILPENQYTFIPEVGFVLSDSKSNQPNIFDGKDLCAIATQNYQDLSTLNAAKRLMRAAITHWLGYKLIHSRSCI